MRQRPSEYIWMDDTLVHNLFDGPAEEHGANERNRTKIYQFLDLK